MMGRLALFISLKDCANYVLINSRPTALCEKRGSWPSHKQSTTIRRHLAILYFECKAIRRQAALQAGNNFRFRCVEGLQHAVRIDAFA